MVKKKEGNVAIKKAPKSKKKGQVYDLTREITGLDSEHLHFDAKRKEVTRLINSIKKVSDIPKNLELNSNNFNEFAELLGNLINDDKLNDINKRICKGKKVEIKEYDLIINKLKDIIDKRDDDDIEKKMLSDIIDNIIPNQEEEELINTISDNIHNIISGIMEFDNRKERFNYYRKVINILDDIDMSINRDLENYNFLKERINMKIDKYPQLRDKEIDITDIDKLGIDCVAEVIGLPTVDDMIKIIQEKIDKGLI